MYIPKDEEKVFRCLYCNAITQHEWELSSIKKGKLHLFKMVNTPPSLGRNSSNVIITPAEKNIKFKYS